MILKKQYIASFIIASCLFSYYNILGQNISDNIDTVPRDRLITDSELLQLFDSKYLEIENVTIDNLVEYFSNRKTPKYFFNSSTVDDDIKRFFKEFPQEEKNIRKKVEEHQSSYGNDIDWLLPGHDLVGRSLTPNTIRYMARFPLAYEYALEAIGNNNSESLNNFLSQLRDFIIDYENNEVESEENDVFERFYAGHRTRNLLFAHNILMSNDRYKKDNLVFMLKVFLLHGAKLIDVCEKFHWGNHQLHGLAGLYEMTTMFPEFPVMRLWNKLALKTIMEHIDKEIKSDGFQFERASHYYKLDIMNYFRIYKISKMNNINLPDLFMSRFNSMFDAYVSLALPSRNLPILQDAQAKYKKQNGNLGNNDAAELNDPKESLYLTIGAEIFNNPVYKYFGDVKIPSDLYWFFTEDEREHYLDIKVQKPNLGSVGLEESHYYVMRNGWEKDSYYLLIDGGLAKYKPDHTHGGILGLFANVKGENVLPTYRVRYSKPTYRYLKNSLVKNVALADNIVQGKNWKSNNARTGFGNWQYLPKPTVNDWIVANNYDYFSGSHTAFNTYGIDYNRSILFFKQGMWIVLDEFNSDNLHSYQQLWQGDFDILNDCNGIVKKSDNLSFYVIQTDFSDMDLEPYSKYGYSSFKFEKKGVSNYTFSTLLFPVLNENGAEPVVREYERNDYKQIVITSGSKKYSYYYNKGEKLDLDEIESDAKFICATYDNDVLISFLVYQGSYCSLEGVNTKIKEKNNYETLVNDQIPTIKVL